MKYNELEKCYTASMVILPALNVYSSFIPSVELGTLIILICTMIFILNSRKERVGMDIMWAGILMLFLLCTFISAYYNPDYSMRYFSRYLKIVVIVVSIMFCGKDHFKYDYGFDVLKKFSIACSVLITIQTVFSFVGIYIPGYLKVFTKLSDDMSSGLDYSDMLYRPCAFFFEPAHFACYQFVFLSYLLSHENVKKRMHLILLTLLGIFLSTSGTGYVLTPLLFIVSYVLKPHRNGNNRMILYTLFVLAGFVFLAYNTSIGQNTIGRFIDSEGQIGGAASGRLESGANLLFYALPDNLRLIGCGFGYRPEDVYFPSLYAILYGDGYIGLIALALMGVIYYFHTTNFGKMLLIAYSLMFMGAGVFNFGVIGLYFIFISLETEIKQNPRFKLKLLLSDKNRN